jgi:flavin-dependent dehydrogenase
VEGRGVADVLIVGGGPAGSAAALACRKAGLRVQVIARPERDSERPGEALSPGVEPLLRSLGADSAIDDALFHRHAGHWIEWGGARTFEAFGQDADGPWRGFQAWRPTFDASLLAVAARSGVVVTEGSAASPIIEAGRVAGAVVGGRPVRARFVLDATGRSRWLARSLRLAIVTASPRLVAWFAYVQGDGGDDGNPTIAADGDGWTWCARIRDGLHQWVRLPHSNLRPARGWVPARLAGLQPVGATRGADVTWRHVPASAGPGYALAGDAALTVDPLSSHGVLRALMSGIVAAELAIGVLGNDASLPRAAREYRRWQAEWFERETRALHELYSAMPDPPAWALRVATPATRAGDLDVAALTTSVAGPASFPSE